MLSKYQIVQMWLANNGARKIELSHGGKGGSCYANLIDEDGDSLADGTGDTPEAAMSECARAISLDDLKAEAEGGAA